MSNIDKYANFISNQQKTLKDDGKLISEREIVINRLMAEGYTAEQIEYILNEAGVIRTILGTLGGAAGAVLGLKHGIPGTETIADIATQGTGMLQPVLKSLAAKGLSAYVGAKAGTAAAQGAAHFVAKKTKQAANKLTNQGMELFRKEIQDRKYKSMSGQTPGVRNKPDESNDLHKQG